MPRFKFVCLVNAKDGQDADFNAWHSNVHLPEVVTHGGFTEAQRMRLMKNLDDGAKSYQYLIIYEGEVDNPDEALNQLNAAVASGKVSFHDSLHPESWAAVYEEIPGASYKI